MEQAEAEMSARLSTSDPVKDIECRHVVNVGNTDVDTPRKDMARVTPGLGTIALGGRAPLSTTGLDQTAPGHGAYIYTAQR